MKKLYFILHIHEEKDSPEMTIAVIERFNNIALHIKKAHLLKLRKDCLIDFENI